MNIDDLYNKYKDTKLPSKPSKKAKPRIPKKRVSVNGFGGLVTDNIIPYEPGMVKIDIRSYDSSKFLPEQYQNVSSSKESSAKERAMGDTKALDSYHKNFNDLPF